MLRAYLAAVMMLSAVCSDFAPKAFATYGDVLDLGFEAGQLGERPADWVVPMDGWKAVLTDEKAADGKTSARLMKSGESNAPFGNLIRSMDAAPFQQRHVKLSAKVRVEGAGAHAQMWLRVDRPNNRMGAFDNMGDRPILPGAWSNAVIEADIDADALRLSLGFMSLGGGTVYVDAVRFEVEGEFQNQEASPPRALSARGLQNLEAAARLLSYVRFFHPSDECVAMTNWDNFAVRLIDDAEPASDAADLAGRLQKAFEPIAPTLVIWAGGVDQAPPVAAVPAGATQLVYWRHMGAGNIAGKRAMNAYTSSIGREELSGKKTGNGPAADALVKALAGGVSCRLPIKVYADAKNTLPHADDPSAIAKTPDAQARLTGLNRTTRLAGVALCWGVMQHFYPYFDVVKTDWNEALTAGLTKAAQDSDEQSYLETLNELIAKLHDGHGNVFSAALAPKDRLPLVFAWAGNDLVVVGKGDDVPAEIRIGDAILSIDGAPIAQCCEHLARGISAATDGWRRTRLRMSLATALRTSDPCPLRLRHPDGAEFDATVKRVAIREIDDVTTHKRENGAELSTGIVYFDLDRTQVEALNNFLPALEKAKGIVFDLRGYPGSAAYELMQHLIDENATSARWNIPIVTLPDREAWKWNDSGRWELHPVKPRLTAHIAFLTDGRAISYAESIMGIVEAYKLGEIVGATTAGTNGNVNPFNLPGGYKVSWTGMKVLKHDGSQHHGVGIAPTIPVEPTAQGIAQGRDEVLEKAVEVLAGEISGESSSK